MTARSWTTALAALALSTTCTAARADEPSNEQLKQEVEQLRAAVKELQAQRVTPTFNAHDVDATVDSVVRDADRRSQLLAQDTSFTAGWDNGFKIRSADGNFVLHPWFQFQFRSVTNYREDANQSGIGDDTQNGFELRRMKFGFDGNVFSPDLTYTFLWATNRHNGVPELEDAWVKYKFADGLAVKAGQIKNPLDHEQIVSSKYQLAVERTLIAGTFVNGDDYVQGVSLVMDNGGALRGEAAFTDGIRSQNQNFQDFPSTTSGNSPTADWGAAGRVEYKLMGDWKDYDRFTAMGTRRDLLVLGAAADYTEFGRSGALTHVADVQYTLASGLSIYGAYLGRYTARNTGAGDSDTYDSTFRAFVGYMLNDKLEPFAQYQYIHFDSAATAAGTDNTVHDITIGINYYLMGQSAKFTVDASYLPNGSPVSDDSSGVLANNGKNEAVIRAQFQLLL
jgi:hypothetical protein